MPFLMRSGGITKAPQAMPALSTFLRMADISTFLTMDSAFFWWTSMMPLMPASLPMTMCDPSRKAPRLVRFFSSASKPE